MKNPSRRRGFHFVEIRGVYLAPQTNDLEPMFFEIRLFLAGSSTREPYIRVPESKAIALQQTEIPARLSQYRNVSLLLPG